MITINVLNLNSTLLMIKQLKFGLDKKNTYYVIQTVKKY